MPSGSARAPSRVSAGRPPNAAFVGAKMVKGPSPLNISVRLAAATAPRSVEKFSSSAIAVSRILMGPAATSPSVASPMGASPITASPITASPSVASPITASPSVASAMAVSPSAASPVAVSPAAVSESTTSVAGVVAGAGSSSPQAAKRIRANATQLIRVSEAIIGTVSIGCFSGANRSSLTEREEVTQEFFVLADGIVPTEMLQVRVVS